MPSQIQFGAETFTAATSRAEGIPNHAVMIGGELIHLDKTNLKGWGVTAAAEEQIIEGMVGIPIRACNNPDPHACDFASDNFANVGYVTGAEVEDGWIIAEAAITDREAAKKIHDKTWMPFGKGSWSVTGFPSDPTPDFETSGLTNGFTPDAIALIIGNGKPAFEGSGFELVAAAIKNYEDGNIMTKDNESEGNPRTYTQAELDKEIKETLAKQKTDDAATAKKATDDEKAIYEEKIAGMTSKDDMKTILEAHGKKVQEDTLDTLKRQELMTEYRGVMEKSPVAGAPFMKDEKFNQELFNAEMPKLEGMQTAALKSTVDQAKMVAAAVPGIDSTSLEYSSTPPGSEPDGVDQKALNAMGIPSITFV